MNVANLSSKVTKEGIASLGLCLIALYSFFSICGGPPEWRFLNLCLVLPCFFGAGWFCQEKIPSRFDLFFVVLVSLALFALPFLIQEMKCSDPDSRNLFWKNLMALSIFFVIVGVPLQLGVYCRHIYRQLG